MAYFIYRHLALFLAVIARRVGFVHSKLKARNLGLKDQQITRISDCIWIHCASLGEFEQGKVLIDALRERYPEKNLVLTFFSSSGYEKRNNYPNVDYVYYLPYDTPKEINRFVDKIRPTLVVFVKYEFWFNLLHILHRRRIPFVFVSAVFRPSQYLFQFPFRSLLERILAAEHIFVQNEESRNLLAERQYHIVTIAGDTRIDRVLQLRTQEFRWPALRDWTEDQQVVIAGSTWPKDEVLISKLNQEFGEWKWIIAPHEIQPDHLESLRRLFGSEAVFLSDIGMDQPIPNHKKVVIIDQIGLLSLLYRFGNIAYIGGGHGSGIHNTLEPAVYGIPLIFGPKYEKFQEAVDFVDLKIARMVRTIDELGVALVYYAHPYNQEDVSALLQEYFSERSGSVELIMDHLAILISKT